VAEVLSVPTAQQLSSHADGTPRVSSVACIRATSGAPNGIACELRGRFHVPKPQRRDGCSDCAAQRRKSMSAGVPPARPCSTEALQRRAEDRPRRLHTLVRRRRVHSCPCDWLFASTYVPHLTLVRLG
jgi:hypothetical protein